MIPTPDLLHAQACLDVDERQLEEVLGLAFTGKGEAPMIDEALASSNDVPPCPPEQFAPDLFLDTWIRQGLQLEIDGQRYGTNHAFLFRIHTTLVQDLETTQLRQGILRELATSEDLLAKTYGLYKRLHQLVHMFKMPGRMARLDINTFRIDLLSLAKRCVDSMVTDFEGAHSGLARLHAVGKEIQASDPYQTLASLLDYHQHRATLSVELRVGADGRIKHLDLREIRYNRHNRFFLGPWKHMLQRLSALLLHGFELTSGEMSNRLLQSVFDTVAPALLGQAQLMGQLEVYLTQHQFAERAVAAGLDMCLPEFVNGDSTETGSLELENLFNPLLLSGPSPPVPCQIHSEKARSATLITGPNSGGKTRLLQALGLAQLLGQNGFYVAASRARLLPVRNLFVSLIEHEAIEHSEGRLGRELERIRTLFETMQGTSMVLLDELCSGTNPSEGSEVFSLVLRLLEKVQSVTFITTHFLDYARDLQAEPPVDNLHFLQVEIVDQHSTYQFVPGVADTSLATVLAERMGITFERISAMLEARTDPAPEKERETARPRLVATGGRR